MQTHNVGTTGTNMIGLIDNQDNSDPCDDLQLSSGEPAEYAYYAYQQGLLRISIVIRQNNKPSLRVRNKEKCTILL